MNKSPEISNKFICIFCDYKCRKKSEWDRHIMTSKHKNRISPGFLEYKIAKPNTFVCKYCSKQYTARNSLWYHEIKCGKQEENNLSPDTSLIVQLMKQNDDFKHLLLEQNKSIVEQNNKVFETHSQLIEMCKNGIINNNSNNNQINSNNKTFNLQVFLNEDCKDAMNIGEFIDSIDFQLADLEQMGKIGYVDGISNIIIKNLKALDVHKRPVHCTDQKRETIYIKDDGVWTKDEEDNKNVRKLIKRVAFRNSKCIRLFKEKHPDCIKSESRYSDIYSKIIIEAMGGGSKCNDLDNDNKIIRKIAKEMTIDKINFS